MKNTFAFAALLSLFTLLGTKTYAQNEESRTKIQMTIVSGGKSITVDLNSVSTSLSRSYDELPTVESKDTVKNKNNAAYPGAFYLTVDAKRISDDLLRVFAKKKDRFDGTVTITDTYGKIPTRTIRFKKASLYNYSDQMSTASYGSDSYGSSALSFGCEEVAVNGIVIEQ